MEQQFEEYQLHNQKQQFAFLAYENLLNMYSALAGACKHIIGEIRSKCNNQKWTYKDTVRKEVRKDMSILPTELFIKTEKLDDINKIMEKIKEIQEANPNRTIKTTIEISLKD